MNEINLQAPCNRLGYGVTGTNLCVALAKLGIKVNLFPIGPMELSHEKHAEPIRKCLDNRSTADWNAPTLKIYHQNMLFEHIGRGTYYGFPIFELDKFSAEEEHSLVCPSHIFTTCKWANSVVKSYVASCSVVPLGVDTNIFKPNDIVRPDQPYTFFCTNKWEKRKCHDIIPRCFDRAFVKKDNVRLKMCCHNPFLTPQETQAWVSMYRGMNLVQKISFVKPFEDVGDLVKFINGCDCGLYMSRAEGWNLPLLEAMACGKHVITTNYSAHTEFCTSDNADLIDITDVEPAYDNKWFSGQGNWAEFDYDQEEQLVEYMRAAYKAGPVVNSQGLATASEFSWENSAQKIVDMVFGE